MNLDEPVVTSAGPVIGLTAYGEPARWGVWVQDAVLLHRSYTDAVAAAGGVPVLLPPLPGVVERALDRLDALVLTGGADVDPVRYGEPARPTTDRPRTERDAAELGLLRLAIDEGLPTLAVCRGLQLLNVLRGGTLHQHLPDVVGHTEHAPEPGGLPGHRVSVAGGSRLAGLLEFGPEGGVLDAPTHHHQAVRRLGTGLAAVAWADDGTIEAVEDPTLPYCVGVQWHPEADAASSPASRALFAGLVAAARMRPAMVIRPAGYVSRSVVGSGGLGEPGVDAARSGPTVPVGTEDAGRDLERLADRLRVVAPRLARRESEESNRTLREVRDGLQRLADLAADAGGEPRRTVPELAPHALSDQALVLGHELLALPAAPLETAVAIFERLRRSL